MPAFTTTVEVDKPAEVIYKRIAEIWAHQTRVSAQPGLIIFVRRYRPGWAITLAIIGLIFFLLGLLFLLVKKEEVLTVTITPREPGKCLVAVTGEGSNDLIIRVQSAITGAPMWPQYRRGS